MPESTQRTCLLFVIPDERHAFDEPSCGRRVLRRHLMPAYGSDVSAAFAMTGEIQRVPPPPGFVVEPELKNGRCIWPDGVSILMPVCPAPSIWSTEMQLDPRRTALVVIDPQKWTLGMPVAPHASPDILGRIKPLIRALRPDGFVVWTRAAFSAGYADMLKVAVDMELKVPSGGLPPDLLRFDQSLDADEPDLVITKRQWSAFYGTELDLQLRRRRIETLVVAGVMTNFGVESTARDGWQHNYSMIVAEDACSSINAEMHEFAIARILPRVARVRSTEAIIEALSRVVQPE